ncbi:MAG: DUF192 domain-containing protein [Candidatus Aenigmarchaeota archaeon]|nr:DUF192 domain-containing protein [Candidatus Aenigmarchaeota archaeon]
MDKDKIGNLNRLKRKIREETAMCVINVKIGKKQLRIKDCKGIASVRGLMFDDMKKYDGTLIYANSIWMPFVRHELDLLFLSADFRIVDIKRAVPVTLNLKTWRIYKCNAASYCLELKAGLVRAKKGMVISVLGQAFSKKD